MIDHVDNLLRQLFISRIDEITDESQVRFQPPDDAWRTYVANLNVNGQPVNALNVFLTDLRENRTLRSNERVREFANGMIMDAPAPRRVDCHYLLTAWSPATVTANIEPTVDEHALLYKAIGALMTSEPIVPSRVYAPDPLPAGFPAIIADEELPAVTLPVEGFHKIAEFWGTFGAVHPWKPLVYFVITIPVVLTTEVAGPMVTTRISEYRQTGRPGTAEIFIQIGGAITASGNPVSGAWVRLEDTIGTALATATTQDNGRFSFGGLTQGTFVIRVRAQGFNEATRTVDVPSATGNYDVQLI